MVKCYDNCHHFSTPSPPLTIGIIIEVNDDNCGRPLTQGCHEIKSTKFKDNSRMFQGSFTSVDQSSI